MSEMPEPDKILRMRTVLERTGLSRSTLYRKMHDGTFPNQIRISEHCCGWRESAINRWMADPVSYTDENARSRSNGSSAPSRQRVVA
jgi:prophage regulatory protein